MDHSRACILVVDQHVLAAALNLPGGSQIDAVESPADEPGTLRLRVRGMGPKVNPGEILLQVRGNVERRSYVQHTITWNLKPEGPPNVQGNVWGFLADRLKS